MVCCLTVSTLTSGGGGAPGAAFLLQPRRRAAGDRMTRTPVHAARLAGRRAVGFTSLSHRLWDSTCTWSEAVAAHPTSRPGGRAGLHNSAYPIGGDAWPVERAARSRWVGCVQ